MLSAEPVSKEQQSLIDQVFSEMQSELRNEKTSLLTAKRNKSIVDFYLKRRDI
jgi:hypothetical protein